MDDANFITLKHLSPIDNPAVNQHDLGSQINCTQALFNRLSISAQKATISEKFNIYGHQFQITRLPAFSDGVLSWSKLHKFLKKQKIKIKWKNLQPIKIECIHSQERFVDQTINTEDFVSLETVRLKLLPINNF